MRKPLIVNALLVGLVASSFVGWKGKTAASKPETKPAATATDSKATPKHAATAKSDNATPATIAR